MLLAYLHEPDLCIVTVSKVILGSVFARALQGFSIYILAPLVAKFMLQLMYRNRSWLSRSTDVVRDYQCLGKTLFLGFFVFCYGFILAGRPVKSCRCIEQVFLFVCFFTVVCYSDLGLMHGTFSFLFPLKMVEFSPPEIRSASNKTGRGAGVML